MPAAPLLSLMQQARADFTLVFRHLSAVAGVAGLQADGAATQEAPLRALNVAPLRVLSVESVMGPAPKVD